MRIESVLVPIDFSPASTVALNCAISCARQFRANLTLLHVLESREEDADQAHLKLSALVASEDQDDLSMQTLAIYGRAQEQIPATLHEQHADLVVMGTHGRRFIDRSLIGSVTLSILRQIAVPILTVSHAIGPLRFERILFATDLSGESLSAFQSVLDIAQTARSSVTFLHAAERPIFLEAGMPTDPYILPDYVEQARAKLNELALEGSHRNVRIEPVLVEKVPAEAILQTAEDKSADVIVMTAEHKSLLERALLGSTAERVIRNAKVPVLSIPKGAKRQMGQPEQRPAA
jgi:nucleotide-binding universal stress UspA family protein